MNKVKIVYIPSEEIVVVSNWRNHDLAVLSFHNWDLLPHNEVEAPPKPPEDEDEPDREEWES